MLQAEWEHHDIETTADANAMAKQFKQGTHLAGAFDTETTGLHIILDRPFLFQFGWVDTDFQGYTYAVDLEKHPKLAHDVIKYWHTQAATLPVYLAHNVKFDLHMLTNIGLPYTESNISDTLFYIRYAHDALTPRWGGPPLALKDYAARYITPSAKLHEQLLKQERTAIAKAYNQKLVDKLKPLGYNLKRIDDLFKDCVFTADDLPDDAREVYFDWYNNDLPRWLQEKVTARVESDMIQYNKLNRQTVVKYAHLDIVWVLEIWLKLNPVLHARGNERGVEIENQLIYPLLEMERVGFKIRKEYLLECRDKMKTYILQRRNRLYELAGEHIKVGQSARIVQLMQERFGQTVESSSAEVLDRLASDLQRANAQPECVEFIRVLDELRTLEKWYAVYILRFIRDLQHTDRLYTTIHQVGTVSGRVTSDFQQFPKDAIKTVDGEELFQPRKMVTITEGYDAIVYLDYSQIELRFQALYTILVGNPDLNLCRAYMPYQCVSESGEEFNYSNPEHIRHWKDPWFYKEDPTKAWTPTDVHGATTKAAFDIDETHPDFHRLRYVGKRVNFAKNYGAQYGKICQMFPEYDAERCRKIDAAYYTAFPGVKAYHAYCYDRQQYSYTTNLFGIRYYNVSGHKLINMLVQGSAAFYLKLKIIQLYNYSKEHNLKTRWQMQIHDELSWEHHIDDDPAEFFEFKRIMEDWDEALVPIVADMEVTTTTWAEKVEVETEEELRTALHEPICS